MNTKPIRDIEPGDVFSYSTYGTLEFLGWVTEMPLIERLRAGVQSGAYVKDSDNRLRCVSLNLAGSVLLLNV